MARLEATRVVRAWKRFSDRRGNRLAGAVTFYGFVSLIPLLMLAVGVVFRLLGDEGVAELQAIVDDNFPSLGIDLTAIREAVATLTLIALPTLLWTGLGWVDSVRASVRSMWDLDDRPGSFVQRKALDTVALLGLGGVVAVSMAATSILSAGQALLDRMGATGPVAAALTWSGAGAVAIGTSTLLFGLLLSGMPRIPMPWSVLLPVSLAGGLAFEAMKNLAAVLVTGSAWRSAVAAFAAPLAVLAWVYLVTRVLMYLAAFSAEWVEDRAGRPAGDDMEAPTAAEVDGPTSPPLVTADGRPVLAMTPGARQARTVGLAAGSVLGAAGVGVVILARRGLRAVVEAVRR